MATSEERLKILKMIQEGKITAEQGMRLLDNHLKTLVEAGKVTVREAARVSADPAKFLEMASSEESERVTT